MSQPINSKSLIDVEVLCTAQVQIESWRERYYDFYDLAPVGYCTLSEQGLILEANLTAATLLGTNRGALTRQPFSRFIFKEDQDLHSLHREQLVETGEVQEYDLRLLKSDGAFFWVHLKATAAQAEDGAPVSHVVLVDITERKQAEDALQTAVAFQEKLLQNLLAGVIIVDPVTRQIEQVNEHAAALFGTPAERLIGQRCHAQICPAEEGACPVCDQGKTVDSSERVLIRADGSRLPILKTVKHVSLGGQEKLLECFVDISERTLAEEALRGNVTLLKTVLSAITGPLAVINTDDYSIAMANEAFGGDTVVGKSCFAVSHNLSQPCSGSDHPCPLLQVVSSGQAFTTEHIHFTKSGEPLNIEITAYPIFDDFGKVRQIVEFGQDVTQRKRAEEKLREQRDFAEGLIETAQSIILVLDTQGRIVQFNSYMEELGGYGLDEVKGQDWFETFIMSDNSNLVKSVFQDTVGDIQTSGTVNTIIAKDGRTILVEWSNKTLKDKDGLIVGVLAIGQDITEKKNYQQAQLRSGQLSALGEVAAGVAHEINNPINGVINYAQLLINRNSEDDQSNQILERIIREGSRISSIVKNLLNFATKDRNAFSSLDITDIVTEPINLQAQMLKRDGINIDLRVPSDLPKIYGNRMQLEQVVLNLLSNARHALHKKYPQPCNEKCIVIEAAPSHDNNGGWVQLSIKDFGCGIAKEHLEKIFNPFFTTKEAGVGTGLGLSVSHEILEKHSATISVESEVDKFTNITMTFPANSP